MVEAICWIMRTGSPWRDLPAGFGRWGSVYTRWRRWIALGLWARLLRCLARKARGVLRFVDCSHIKTHHDASNPCGGQTSQAMGKTMGGLNTKLAAAVDALLPILRGRRLVADKAFDADRFARRLRALRIRICIPARASRRSPCRSTAVSTGRAVASKTVSSG